MKAFGAGIAIGIAALVNLQLGGIPGAIFFAVGLLTICINKLDLVTGKGSALVHQELNIWQTLQMLFFNVIGVFIVWLVGQGSSNLMHWQEVAMNIVNIRLKTPWYGNIGVAIICGFCIQFACANYKKLPSALGILVPASVFVLLGCNHCIADFMYYLLVDDKIVCILPWLETIVGNLLGACIMAKLMD